MKRIVKWIFDLGAPANMFTQCCQSTRHWLQSLGSPKYEC